MYIGTTSRSRIRYRANAVVASPEQSSPTRSPTRLPKQGCPWKTSRDRRGSDRGVRQHAILHESRGTHRTSEHRSVRACGHSSDGDCRSDEVDHGAIARVRLLVARCYSAEFLELAKEVFDQMSPFVHLEIAIDGRLSVGFRRNDGDGAAVVEFGAQPIVVEGFVGEQSAERDTRDQRFDANAIMSLTRQQDETRQIAERIDKREYFGRQTSARTPDRLILSPPLAPGPSG
jgi:hypothetical protein